MDRKDIEKKMDALVAELDSLNDALDALDGPRSLFGRFRRGFLNRYWSLDHRLFRFSERLYFSVYFWLFVIVFLDVILYVFLPAVSVLLSFLGTGTGGL